MKSIIIKNANIHNLKNVSVKIPLQKLVVVVGPSGSGKTSLIYDVLYKSSQGDKVECSISRLPNIFAIGQKVTVPKGLKAGLGEYNLQRLDRMVGNLKKNDLLIVDEPCAGLNAEESVGVLNKLKKLVKSGKSVIAIEHSKEIIKGADSIIEFGPKSGKYGGEIVFQGSLSRFKKSKSITADYVFSDKAKNIHYKRNPSQKAKAMQKKSVTLQKINKNNLKNYTFKFPLGSLVCVFGSSGTGKSTILNVVYSALFKGKNAWKIREKRGTIKAIIGKQNVRRTYLVEQTSIGKHPTSRPATYLNIWDSIRDIYANLPKSKKAGLKKSNFIVTKKIIEGKEGFSLKVSLVKYRGVGIGDLLELTIDEAVKIFSDSKLVKRKLKFLQEAGLGYLTLGQKSDSLSGGEAQRVRLAKVLSKKLGDRCIYILDTPTKGLHLSDLPVLVSVLQKIIDRNNTVLIADNKIEIINNSDYGVDMNKR
ncbi:ATP-binding cassette domain-containing protein [Patescibacteria group bacterium]|nr:ATP-binding cassette domain-containing protein [Patescibacteria group bacterium]